MMTCFRRFTTLSKSVDVVKLSKRCFGLAIYENNSKIGYVNGTNPFELTSNSYIDVLSKENDGPYTGMRTVKKSTNIFEYDTHIDRMIFSASKLTNNSIQIPFDTFKSLLNNQIYYGITQY